MDGSDAVKTASTGGKVRAAYLKAAGVVGALFAFYHLYTTIFGFPGSLRHRAVFVLFAFVLGFLTMPISGKTGKKPLIWDTVLVIMSILAFGYLWVEYTRLPYRIGEPNTLDMLFGITAIVLIYIFTRRRIGWVVLILPTVMLLYALYGDLIPTYLGHAHMSLKRVVNTLYMGTSGVFSEPVGAAANYIVIFVIFGKFLEATGSGDYFIKLAFSLVGRVSSGAGLTAVLASGLFGSISGSPSANVVTTGTFTIPLMRRQGFDTEFSGAVEAVASTGGQVMPPVMGATAFIICETLNVGYLELAAAALCPALVYYVAVAFSVHLQAKKMGIKGATDVPRISDTLKKGWFLLLPLVVLIAALVLLKRSVFRAAIYGIVTAIIVSWVNPDKSHRITPKVFYKIMSESGLSMLTVAAATTSAGIVIGCLTLTGLGAKLAIYIKALAGGYLIVALLLTWVVAVALGMGMPTTASYITTASLLVPALSGMGLHLTVAHMFCFYAAIISNLTPPVCVASYTAAGISGGNAFKTGIQGFLLGLPGPFLVPFMFAMRPGLLLISSSGVLVLILDIVCCFAACLMLSVAMRGYLFTTVPLWQKAAAFAAGLLFISNARYTNWVGLALVFVVVVVNYIWSKRSRRQDAM